MARLVKSSCIGAITFLIISFNGGIGVGGGNHVDQLPVVRRVLDPHYLPGDFSMEIRRYHHRVFTYLIAACSVALGEDWALIFLHAVGMTLLSASLWRLCQTLHLSRLGFLAVGLFLAVNFVWTGKGLEKNHLVDDPNIMPPTFANALVLFAVASLLEERYRLTALFAGLAGLFHVQIGLICAAMLAPFYLFRLKRIGMKELFGSIALFCLAAAPGLLDLLQNETIASIQFIRLSPLITVFGAICLIVVINVWARERVDEGGQGRVLALTNAGLILIAASWGLWSAARPGGDFRLAVSRHAEQASSWVSIWWIKDHGARGAVYLTPPGKDGFTYLSDRSNVVEFKNNPDGAICLSEWFERLRDLAGGTLPNGRGFENAPLLNQAYAALEPEQLAELGAKYRAEFAVLPNTARTTFEIVYQNEHYVLVKMPASVGIAAQTPKPSDPDDAEMGVAAPTSARAKVDPAVLARFDVEYRRAGVASRPVFDEYLPILGTAALLDYLEGRFPDCHSEGHDLGRALYALRRDVGIALRECGTRCTSACMHGVVGEAFGTTDLGSIAGAMDGFCATGAMAEVHRPGNCAHGIGHALMFTTGDDVDRALDTCLHFDDPGMRYYCATGVFMEYLVPKRKGTARPVLHDPCDLYPQYAAACYRYRAKTMLGELGGDPAKLLRQCQSLQGSLRRGCFHGLGSALSGRVIADPSVLGRICRQGDAKDRIMCIEGAIEKMADHDETKAMAVCATLEGADREVCAAAAKGKMYRLGKPSMPLYHDSKLVETRRPLVKQPKAHEHEH